MNTDLFVKLFAHVANPPTFKVIDPDVEGDRTVQVVGTPFYVTSNITKVKGITGMGVRQYTLAAETEDDYVELFTHTHLPLVVTKAVAEYVEWRCRNTLDDMAWDAQAADYAEDQRMLHEAYDAGRAYFNATSPEKRTRADNPLSLRHRTLQPLDGGIPKR